MKRKERPKEHEGDEPKAAKKAPKLWDWRLTSPIPFFTRRIPFLNQSSAKQETDSQPASETVPPTQSSAEQDTGLQSGGGTVIHKQSSVKSEMCSQSQSTFISMLPAELRRQVYITAFGSWLIYIVKGTPTGSDSNPSRQQCWYFSRQLKTSPEDRWSPDYSDGAAGFHLTDTFALLLTCRLVYSEGIDLVYLLNTFLFYRNTHQTLLCFAKTIHPQCWNSIQRLDLVWHFRYQRELPGSEYSGSTDVEEWEELWDAVASMRGLRKIRMRCGVQCPWYKCEFESCRENWRWVDRVWEEKIFTPLLAVGRRLGEGEGHGGSIGWSKAIENRKASGTVRREDKSTRSHDGGDSKDRDENATIKSINIETEGASTNPFERRKTLDVFEITVPWSKGPINWNAVGAPFKVIYRYADVPCPGYGEILEVWGKMLVERSRLALLRDVNPRGTA